MQHRANAVRAVFVVSILIFAISAVPCTAGVLLDPGGVIERIEASPVENMFYATLDTNEIISAAFGATTVTNRVTVLGDPGALAVSPDGSKLYVVLQDTYDVAVYNTSGLSYVTTIDVSDYDLDYPPSDLAVSATRLYAWCVLDGLSIVDTTTYNVISVGSIDRTGGVTKLDVSLDGKLLALTSSAAGVLVYDVSDDDPLLINKSACWPSGCNGSSFKAIEFSSDFSRIYVMDSHAEVHHRNETGIIYLENECLAAGTYPTGMTVNGDESLVFVTRSFPHSLNVTRTSDWLPFNVTPLQGEPKTNGIIHSSEQATVAVAIAFSSPTYNRIEMINVDLLPVNRGAIRLRPLDALEGIPVNGAQLDGGDAQSAGATYGFVDVSAGFLGVGPFEEGDQEVNLRAGLGGYLSQTLSATVIAGEWTDLGDLEMSRTGDYQSPLRVGVSMAGVIGSTVEVLIHGLGFCPGSEVRNNFPQPFSIESYSWVDWSTISATVTAPTDMDPGEYCDSVAVWNSPLKAGAGDFLFLENDAKLVQASSAATAVDEGAGTITIEVTRTGPSAGAVGVNWRTLDGTAVAGSDYNADSGTLDWPDGDMTPQTITITINQDSDIEGDEEFTIELDTPTGGAVLGDIAATTVTILDDDDSTLELEPATAEVDETAGAFSVQVTRTGDLTDVASVAVTTVPGTATDPDDYTGVSTTLSWGVDDGSPQTIVVPIINDDLHEGNEGFSITLSGPTGNGTLGAIAETLVTIVDDDQPAFRLGSAAIEVGEADGVAVIEVLRVGPSGGSYSVAYGTADGSAEAGADYTATAGTLTWVDGNNDPQMVEVPITGDSGLENDETFTFSLSNPSGGAVLYEPSTLTVTISDDDCALSFVNPTLSIAENGGSVNIAVRRSGVNTGAVSANYSITGGTATAGEDFVQLSGTVQWADGDGSDQIITLTVIDDVEIEGGESVIIGLSNPQGHATIGTPSTITVTIADDDWQEFRVNTTTVSEQTRPTVCMDATGGSVTGWDSYGQDGDGWGAYGIRHDSRGQLIGDEFRFSVATAGHQRDIRVACALDGRFAAVWSGPDASGSGVYLRRFSAAGAAQGGEVLVNTTTALDQGRPVVAMDDQGRILVVWESPDSDGGGIFAQAFAADGTPAGGERRLNQTTANEQLLPAVATLPGVGFVAVWESIGQDGPASGIIGRRLGVTGVPAESEWIANGFTSGEQQRAAVAGNGDGFVVVWQDANHLDGDGWSIRFQRFDSTAGVIGSEIGVNEYGTGTQGDPTVSLDSDGVALVGWESDGQDGSSMGVYLRVFWPDGLVSSEVQANLYTTGTQDEIDVAGAPDGTYFAVWASGGQDGSGDGVYGVRAGIPFRTHIFSDGFESGDTGQW
jgi:hypothetical protein